MNSHSLADQKQLNFVCVSTEDGLSLCGTQQFISSSHDQFPKTFLCLFPAVADVLLILVESVCSPQPRSTRYRFGVCQRHESYIPTDYPLR
jgi:hypothetical protein